jgi:hypothetical protein
MIQHLEQLKSTIKQAWITLSMLPDPDARFRQALGSSWTLPTFRSIKDGDYPCENYTKLIPSPHEISTMEAVFEWLAWLKLIGPPYGGEYAIKRIAAWALGSPIWRLAQRERCSERTIHNRIDMSIAKISGKFKDMEVEIKPIDETEPRPARIRGFTEKPEIGGAGSLEPGRVYVEGVGFMFRGEAYRSAYDGPVYKSGRKLG